MTNKRKKYSQQFKFKVALEAINEIKTINEIASTYDVYTTQVKGWKKQLLAEGPTAFGQNTAQQLREQAARETELYERPHQSLDYSTPADVHFAGKQHEY